MIQLPRSRIVADDITRQTLVVNEEFAKADLARSGLTLEDIPIYVEPLRLPANVDVSSLIAKAQVPAGIQYYVIPYYHADGTPIMDAERYPIMYRKRTGNPNRKYDQPGRADIGDWCTHPYFNPLRLERGSKNGTYVIVEGEKKYSKLLKEEGLYGCAIGGKDNWRNGEGNIHPVMVEDIRSHMPERILVVPDGDWHRQDIFASFSMLVYTLQRRFPNVEIKLADISQHRTIDDQRMGIDDYLVAGLRWADVELVDLENELLLSQDVLIERYGLEFDVVGSRDSQRRSVRNNHSNAEKLFKNHPLFSGLWLDKDRNMPIWQDEHRTVDVDLTIALQRYCHMPKISVNAVSNAMTSVLKERERSPLAEWLKDLVWDGIGRIDKLFVDCVKGDDGNVEYRIEAARRLLLQLVARRLSPGCKADNMVIFVGKQGIHKSMFWEELSCGKFALLPGGITDKDAKMVIHSTWIIIAEELDFYHTREAASFKQFITSVEDTYRPPYGRSTETHKRRCIFVGNSNDSNFLRDSENRREMPIHVESIDLAWLRDNKEQLLAEAVARFINGERWWSEDGDRVWEEAKSAYVEDIPFRVEIEDAIRMILEGEYAIVIPAWHANPVVAGKSGFTFDRLQFVLGGVKISHIKLNSCLVRLGWEKLRVQLNNKQIIAWFKVA